jgi:hypothetical protein
VEVPGAGERCPHCGAPLHPAIARDSAHEAHPEESEPPPAADWLTAGVFTTLAEAEMARGFLHAAGIAAEIVDKEMHVQPYGMSLLGEVFLRVPSAELGRAKRLLGDAERGHMALPDNDPGPGEDR